MYKSLYYIKIGNRYLSWVDENWYETNTKEPTFISWDEVIKYMNLLKKHYVYNAVIFESVHNNLCFIN